MGLFRDTKCTGCSRVKCICRNVQRGHDKTAKRQGVNPAPRRCLKCGRTVRGGICPGPDC